jgi:hypothetical protein
MVVWVYWCEWMCMCICVCMWVNVCVCVCEWMFVYICVRVCCHMLIISQWKLFHRCFFYLNILIIIIMMLNFRLTLLSMFYIMYFLNKVLLWRHFRPERSCKNIMKNFCILFVENTKDVQLVVLQIVVCYSHAKK